MNNLAEEQEFKEETVAEAIESAKQTTDQDDGFEIEVVDDTPEEDQGTPTHLLQALDHSLTHSLTH